MRELGTASEEEHRNILGLMKELKYKAAYLVGPNFCTYNENPDWKTFAKVEDLCEFLENHKVEGKTVLVKGSRGIKLEKVVPLL